MITGRPRSDVFANAVAHDERRLDAPRAPQLGQRGLKREGGRLRVRGVMQQFTGVAFAEHHTQERLRKQRAQDLGALVQHAAKDWFRGV